MKPIIKVENLGKQYKIGTKAPTYSTLRESVVSALTQPFKSSLIEKKDRFWALRDINFEIYPGEVVGIIGRNGAGKSTLLKILSRITEPTTGSAELYGRAGSLLEVGTGFHPELTGRENIYLNGAILGMKHVEIGNKFDEIVEFAGIEKFIDTPVKRYSSGMYMRLAFAIAAHLDSEILIVDEVLAVGDDDFQKKCLGKIGDIARDGRTVLFVSHNLNAVSLLTEKCILFTEGRISFMGDTPSALREYSDRSKISSKRYLAQADSESPRITRVEVFTSEPNNIQVNGQSFRIEFDINLPFDSQGIGVSFQVIDNTSRSVMASWVYPSVKPLFTNKGNHTVSCFIPKLRLYMGEYYLNVGLADERGPVIFDYLTNLCNFKVEMFGVSSGHPYGWIRDVCTYTEECHWENLHAIHE